MEPMPNPYLFRGQWFWYDETGAASAPYRTERAAMRALLCYLYWLTYPDGPTRWQRLWSKIKEFWYDTRGAR